jgi:type II secretory pathway component PulC
VSLGRLIARDGRRATALLVCSLIAACATTPPPEPIPEEPPPLTPAVAPAPPAPPACTAFSRPGVLRRSALNRALNESLGRWLSGVEVKAAVEKGRFRGWVIRSLYPSDVCYRQVDLRPGDLVMRVNGKSIEKPEQANEVFQSLRTAPALEVELVREGAPMKITFPIAEE